MHEEGAMAFHPGEPGLPAEKAHLHNHLHSGQRGAKVLGMWGPHSDGHTATVQTAIECSDEVHAWGYRADG
jgi:hypothetical protein